MSFYNAYENIHVNDKQYGEYIAYDANLFTPNLPTHPVQGTVLDEQVHYDNYEGRNRYNNNVQQWRSTDEYFHAIAQTDNLFAAQNKMFAPGEDWQSKGQPYYSVSWDQ